ncbi:MAG: glycosyltransferase family 4 protein, partial [Candidatus Andersenbacteria bacterium]
IAQQQNLSKTLTHVIYNPVSPEFLTVPLKPATTRDLLFVGTVEKYKGVELLLNAFHAFAQKESDVHLKIVGDGRDKGTYEKLVGSLGLQYRVTFLGRIPYTELLPIYDSAAIVVAPHLWIEPFGRTVVEAMARGRVVVAANVGGPAEIIKPGTGLLFEQGNVASLAEALHEAVALKPLDYREIAGAARRWVEEHLKPDHIAAQHEQVYQQMLNGKA